MEQGSYCLLQRDIGRSDGTTVSHDRIISQPSLIAILELTNQTSFQIYHSMNIKPTRIHPDLVEIALERVEGFAFESFAQDLCSVIQGGNFVPTAPQGDGGADGLYESNTTGSFYQFTRQENHRDKIRKTIKRLREFGRIPDSLFYMSSRSIPHIDMEEDLLTKEIGVVIRIRDRNYVLSHINNNQGTINAYNNHLAPYTEFLSTLGTSLDSSHSLHIKDPSAYVFLQHELTNRRGNRKLVHSIADTLILWALTDTDPDNDKFLKESEIYKRIYKFFPWAESILKPHILSRLKILRSKKVDGRELRWHKKENKYCLPFETRKEIKEENLHDEKTKLQLHEDLKFIASEFFDDDEGAYDEISNLAINVIHRIFSKQGLLFSSFISSKDQSDTPLVVSDCIDEILTEANIAPSKLPEIRDYVESSIRRIFYHSTESQRQYLVNLSRTYVLLFTLQAEPRVIEYFSNMGASFDLFLGTDVIVKALSERYLPEDNQIARNLLKVAKASGITMFLSECVLEEVYQHIRGTNFEFVNHFSSQEQFMTREITRNSDKILIRAYFYAKSEDQVNGWKSFLGQYINYDEINTPKAREDLKGYLVAQFQMQFIENSQLELVSNSDAVTELSEVLYKENVKKNQELSRNTALLVHGIYGMRKRNKETSGTSEFGMKTWWLTNQTRVLKHTSDLIKTNHALYMMRPEYVLNFIGLAPSCEQARMSFDNIFPSVFGVQLGHRLKEETFKSVMDEVNQWRGLEDGRVKVLMSEMSDKLKTDRLKRYENSL